MTDPRREQILVYFNAEELAAIDAWRATQPRPLLRADAIRELLLRGLVIEEETR